MREPEPFIHISPYFDCRDPDQRDPLERVEHIQLLRTVVEQYERMDMDEPESGHYEPEERPDF